MAVFVIADLHLSHDADKPMDVFGAKWENHTEKLRENWCTAVKDTDTVVIVGDISWGLRFENAVEDLAFIHSLPGKKIISKGNHDLWWQSAKKLREYKEASGADSIDFLYNNAYLAENLIICGTRGWVEENGACEKDKKIIAREAGRLNLSVKEALKLKEQNPEAEIVCFIHYPPTRSLTEIMRENGIKRCWYGHLHGAVKETLPQHIDGIEVHLVSADFLNFKPKQIKE